MNVPCPKCGGTLVYQPMLSSSCHRCVDCAWLSLGYTDFEVARMSREREATEREDQP